MRGRMTLLVPGGFLVNLIGEFALHDVSSNFWQSTSACLNAGASALSLEGHADMSAIITSSSYSTEDSDGLALAIEPFSCLQVEQSLILLDSYNYQVFQSGDLVFQG